jgi:hypothetical protein
LILFVAFLVISIIASARHGGRLARLGCSICGARDLKRTGSAPWTQIHTPPPFSPCNSQREGGKGREWSRVGTSLDRGREAGLSVLSSHSLVEQCQTKQAPSLLRLSHHHGLAQGGVSPLLSYPPVHSSSLSEPSFPSLGIIPSFLPCNNGHLI